MFSFKGRINRIQYRISFIIWLIIVFSLNAPLKSYDFLSVFVQLILLWFVLMINSKRCHDIGHSGWFQFIPFYILWLFFAKSEYGENEWGLNPNGIGNITDEDKDNETRKKIKNDKENNIEENEKDINHVEEITN